MRHTAAAMPRIGRFPSPRRRQAVLLAGGALTAAFTIGGCGNDDAFYQQQMPQPTTQSSSATTCTEFCVELNELVEVYAEAGTWILKDPGYLDITLSNNSSASSGAVGSYALKDSVATVTAFEFPTDDLAAEYADRYVAEKGEPDHIGPAYRDGANRPVGSRLDFDLADVDVVLWYGMDGRLFILEAPPGTGNDFYLGFEL